MQNLGSGGEAKASPADRADAEGAMAPRTGVEPRADQSGRGGTMDTALAANADPDVLGADGQIGDEGVIVPARAQLGQNEIAPYGETAENEPAPDVP